MASLRRSTGQLGGSHGSPTPSVLTSFSLPCRPSQGTPSPERFHKPTRQTLVKKTITSQTTRDLAYNPHVLKPTNRKFLQPKSRAIYPPDKKDPVPIFISPTARRQYYALEGDPDEKQSQNHITVSAKACVELADSLAHDTDFGQAMEECFASLDYKVHVKNLAKNSVRSLAGTKRSVNDQDEDHHVDKKIKTAGEKKQERLTAMKRQEKAIALHNACASRIIAALDREEAYREKRVNKLKEKAKLTIFRDK